MKYVCSFLVILLFAVKASFAQPLIENTQVLNFGALAVPSNLSASALSMDSNGRSVQLEGNLVRIVSGMPGMYQLSGFPPNTLLSISVDNARLNPQEFAAGEWLEVDAVNVENVSTDSQGQVEFSIGARLSTTGSGNSYVDAQYSGSTIIFVEYWQPDVQRVVFNTLNVNIEAELRSTITVSEEQSLNFGTLFVKSSNAGQAVISILPSGRYSIVESDDTRLVSMATPEQAILRVRGAAPNYVLSIVPSSNEVRLLHAEFPSQAPYFILSDLITDPAQTGITDVNGELEIQVGGTLKTQITNTPEIYPSGVYEGVYQVTVSY